LLVEVVVEVINGKRRGAQTEADALAPRGEL
jgi:hypothetical protein